jgi:DNA polymerase
MAGLDARRHRLLADMGVTVWSPRPANPGPSSDAVQSAAEPMVDGWETLEAGIQGCTRCPLHHTRTCAVPGVGDRDAELLIVGEAPGREEDQRGEPFVGRAGRLLDAMLRAIDLNRDRRVYITNVIKSRPPDNRDPKAEELAACRPWLEAQIRLIRPRLILAVGRVSAQQLIGTREGIGKLRGQWHRLGEADIPLLVTYHPAYLLREPAAKARSWADLLLLKTALEAGR